MSYSDIKHNSIKELTLSDTNIDINIFNSFFMNSKLN